MTLQVSIQETIYSHIQDDPYSEKKQTLTHIFNFTHVTYERT